MKGARIKQLREEKGLTQIELADRLKISNSAVAMYETDKREPSDDIKIKMSEFFNCSLDYLMGRSDIRNPEDKIKQEFEFAYHKEMEGLTEEEIADALRFYKKIKYGKE